VEIDNQLENHRCGRNVYNNNTANDFR